MTKPSPRDELIAGLRQFLFAHDHSKELVASNEGILVALARLEDAHERVRGDAPERPRPPE